MPNHINQRIASLRKLIEGGLHQDNLDRIVVECNVLSQDTAYVFQFFVLKHLFADLSAALDNDAVAVSDHNDLTSGIASSTILLLDKMANSERIDPLELETLVSVHLHNLNMFRSR